ncbi:hypothetical protein [Sphaerisporangium sp. TRM90804]|uniref:hypothetical protein n=1 Tax=Sphaerisporangium sp. TRM90804 TaxID=3031113 RepID=UPI00244CCED2|nr:hypothetical protein [Sphaerisporangium sp. TRM90804]MDH2429299.1 hypothetical protein [Sphaerisporangium sp. TRM90804]
MRRHETAISATEGHVDHAPHVHQRASRRAAQRLTWGKQANRMERPRVLRWTCECRQTVYYLMTGGGRAWIRRTVRNGSQDAAPQVTETELMLYPDAERLWERILLGHAR